jgi:hypothetical protein
MAPYGGSRGGRERVADGVRCVLRKVARESVETVGPEPFVMSKPALRLLQRPGVEPAGHRAATLAAPDQARDLKRIKMLEHRRQRHCKRLRQGGDGEFRRLAEADQHGAPGRIRQGRKNVVQAVGVIVNH